MLFILFQNTHSMLYTLATSMLQIVAYITMKCEWNFVYYVFTIFKLLQSIFCLKFLTQIPFLPSAGFISVNIMCVVICSA